MKRSIFLTIIFIFFLSNNLYGNEPKMVLIPAGKFNINASTRYIHLEEYYIDKTEVTQNEYGNIMGKNNFFFKGDNHPAEQISWYKAKSYCENIGKRLPTQLEWENAAIGQAKSKYFWGKDPDAAYAWYGGDYDLGHHPVGTKKPNVFGLFDTSGNVWEWTSTADDKMSKFSGEKLDKRVAMGGAFNVSANLITPISSLALYAKSRLFNVGFRCAK
jgi:formylglycine-generating enzyme required for sulfatase activity